jgi:predicted ATP-grasp superfamily ATP-dependent carboligase
LGFDPELLKQAFGALREQTSGWVMGSGFEASPEMIEALRACSPRSFAFYGNSAKTVALLKNPEAFSDLLDELGIRHPETALSPPSSGGQWLIKRRGGHGGSHVHRFGTTEPAAGLDYFQAKVYGTSLAVAFLADGSKARIVGIHELFLAKSGPHPYAFAGALAHVTLDPPLYAELCQCLDALVQRTQLVGLNGLDLIVNVQGIHVLEINPRPTATIDLYDIEYPLGLFDAHLKACDGILPSEAPRTQTVRGSTVIYCEEPVSVSARTSFPAWCRDIPTLGSRIDPYTPVCTVLAEGGSREQVRRQLKARAAYLRKALARDASIAEAA